MRQHPASRGDENDEVIAVERRSLDTIGGSLLKRSRDGASSNALGNSSSIASDGQKNTVRDLDTTRSSLLDSGQETSTFLNQMVNALDGTYMLKCLTAMTQSVAV